MRRCIIFNKALTQHPQNPSIKIDIPKGHKVSLDNDPHIAVRFNDSETVGTVFLNADNLLSSGVVQLVS